VERISPEPEEGRSGSVGTGAHRLLGRFRLSIRGHRM